jgi:hypothetical protein
MATANPNFRRFILTKSDLALAVGVLSVPIVAALVSYLMMPGSKRLWIPEQDYFARIILKYCREILVLNGAPMVWLKFLRH